MGAQILTSCLNVPDYFEGLMFKGLKRKVKGKLSKLSSRLEVFCRKTILRNFAKYTGNHLCQSLFLNKVAGLRRD